MMKQFIKRCAGLAKILGLKVREEKLHTSK